MAGLTAPLNLVLGLRRNASAEGYARVINQKLSMYLNNDEYAQYKALQAKLYRKPYTTGYAKFKSKQGRMTWVQWFALIGIVCTGISVFQALRLIAMFFQQAKF